MCCVEDFRKLWATDNSTPPSYSYKRQLSLHFNSHGKNNQVSSDISISMSLPSNLMKLGGRTVYKPKTINSYI